LATKVPWETAAFRFRILFLSFFPVRHCRTKSTEGRHRFARLCQAIHAEASLANASTGICPLQLSMDHRIKSGGDE
jgi:hypothetical protein